MNYYEDQTYTRETLIDGQGPWKWINGDTGAWDGPTSDWLNSHREEWFKHIVGCQCCVQAGGNLGLYPRLLADYFDTVYTFEPDPLNFYCLTANCDKDNIIKFQAALGAQQDLISVVRNSSDNAGMHQVVPNGIIPQVTIDSFNLPICDAIILDIEGYEKFALEGAVDTIIRCQPTIIAENGFIPDIIKMMEFLNYQYKGFSVSDHIYVPKARG